MTVTIVLTSGGVLQHEAILLNSIPRQENFVYSGFGASCQPTKNDVIMTSSSPR